MMMMYVDVIFHDGAKLWLFGINDNIGGYLFFKSFFDGRRMGVLLKVTNVTQENQE